MSNAHPTIVSPNDGFKGSTVRIVLGMQAGFGNIAAPTRNTASVDGATPSSSLLNPFKGQSAAAIAEIKAKVGPFIPIVEALNQAGRECALLEEKVRTLEDTFLKIDNFTKTLETPKDDLDTKVTIAKLKDNSSKIRDTINKTKTSLNQVKVRIKEITTEKSINVKEARQSPSSHVDQRIITNLQAQLHNDVTLVIAKVKEANKDLGGSVQRQLDETRGIATPKAKQILEESLRMGG